jgi:nucleoside phosphorylase
MIVALGSLQREAAGIIRAGDYAPADAPDDFIAFQPSSSDSPVVVLSGTGSERANRATKWAIEEFAPEAIISFGFCGATKDNALAGDIVIAARVIDLPGTPFEWSVINETKSLGPDRTMLLAARTAVEISGLDYHHGTIVTVSKKATTAGTKRWLGEAISATAVDTASYAVASAATDAAIPWAVVTSVLDGRDFDSPSIVDRLGSGPNERGNMAYTKHVANHPQDLPALVRLNRAAARATGSLTTFMESFMQAHTALTKTTQEPET